MPEPVHAPRPHPSAAAANLLRHDFDPPLARPHLNDDAQLVLLPGALDEHGRPRGTRPFRIGEGRLEERG